LVLWRIGRPPQLAAYRESFARAHDLRGSTPFHDAATGYRIAAATVVYRGADHLMMVAFEETESEIVAVSIHPLDGRDVAGKISNGRWRA
jgi:hypothetical protein